MLTTEAFNALLKTLEEPPAHVIFLLATTEPHKLPATILSRCQRFDFRRLSMKEITERLRMVADAHKISTNDSALLLISRYAEGAMRDALGIA
jgi:DNA polymerase III subunit gamma/tau